MAFENSYQKMHKLMAKVGCIFCQLFLRICHLDDDVMMATFHWLLLAM